MTEMRKALAATLTGSAAALSYPGSVALMGATPSSFDNHLPSSVSVAFGNLIGRPQDEKQEWTRSAPLQTTYAQRGKRPGAEDRAITNCDAHHTNFIIAGRNAEVKNPVAPR